MRDFLKAWTEPDLDERRRLLEASFAVDGVYTDAHPGNQATGIDQLSALIDNLLSFFPGCSMPLSSVVDGHHDQIRYLWQIVTKEGTVFEQGEDEVQLDADGRMRRVTGFHEGAPETTAPDSLTALVDAFGEATLEARTVLLQTSTTDAVAWSDRDVAITGRSALGSRIGDFAAAHAARGFTVKRVDGHDSIYRVQVEGADDPSFVGSIWAHLAADEAIDWAVLFDGALR